MRVYRCDVCKEHYDEQPNSEFAITKHDNKLDVCSACETALKLWLASNGKFKKPKKTSKHVWTAEQREAAAQRMRARQAERKTTEPKLSERDKLARDNAYMDKHLKSLGPEKKSFEDEE